MYSFFVVTLFLRLSEPQFKLGYMILLFNPHCHILYVRIYGLLKIGFSQTVPKKTIRLYH